MNAPYSCICKNNGLFENSSCHPQARQLQFCDANCLTCMRGVCVLCADLTYYPLGNKCFLCPDGSSSNNDGATCSTCHDSDCKICSGNGDKDCTLCRTLSLQDGKCACDPGYYKEEDSCVNCDPSCATCSGDGTNNCTSCLGPYSPSELNSCSCLTNEFEIQTDPLVCGQCHTSCLTCADSDMDSCLTCKDPEIPDIGNKRACSCLENQYISSKDPFTCNSCHISCKGCIDETSCISCENPKILQDNSCVCPGGYALVDNECVECDKGCSKCNKQPYNCTNCITPYVLYETLCICPENKNCGGSTNEPDQEYLKLTDKFENDLISLIFSEDLVSPLDSSNLGVKTISGIEILTSFELRTISGSQYQISIRFDPKYFSVKADLRLTFIDPIYSIRGLRLETYVYTYSITDHDYSPDTVASEILSKLSTANSRKSIPPASISASVANSFYAKDISFMWTYVNVAQILALMPLQNIKIPSNIKKI